MLTETAEKIKFMECYSVYNNRRGWSQLHPLLF